MLNSTFPSNHGNAITAYSPQTRAPVGEVNADSLNSPVKPVQELPQSDHLSSRTSTSERAAEANLAEESGFGLGRQSVPSVSGQSSDDQSEESSENGGNPPSLAPNEDEQAKIDEEKQKLEEQREQEQLEADQQLIDQLAQRDREVRSHEQAHAAVGGQLAGSPSYEYERGPDGVSYAVGGEVPINTGEVPGDPEATLENARIVQRAALAPAEPSPQDRRVAAEAAQLEQQALQEIALQAQEAQQEAETQSNTDIEGQDDQTESDDVLATAQSSDSDDEQNEEVDELVSQTVQRNIDLNQRLIDIGVASNPVEVGSFLNQTV